MSSVKRDLAEPAERAISENRFRTYARIPDGASLLILDSQPPLVAVASEQRGPNGGRDCILRAVYTCERLGPEGTAQDLLELYQDDG